MKKRMAMLAATAMLAVMLTACGGSDDSATQNNNSAGSVTTEAATNSSDAAKTETTATDEGDLGDYHVKILDAETGLKDYEGNPVIGVKYEYTNNSEDGMMFEAAVITQAFQDGVQLDYAILDSTSDEYDNCLKEIKPGVTLTCEMYYVLSSESEVEIEVAELISLDDSKLVKTFTLE